jgi:hypothetical protein
MVTGPFYMKREPVGSEHEENSWLGSALRQSQSPASDACPDAETLAAWADGGLNVKAAAAVETHTSGCAHCMAVLAAMARTAPVPAARAWTPARVFRWLAPLAAAATAVAIWIAVPDGPNATLDPVAAHDSAASRPGTPNQEPGVRSPEPGAINQPTPAGAEALEPRALTQAAPSARADNPAIEERPQLRDEMRRESAAPQAFNAAPSPPSSPEAPSISADALAGNAATGAPAQRSAPVGRIVVTSESISPLNELFRWRVVAYTSIERSIDGGKSWTKTIPIPGVVPDNPDALTIRSVRAISDVSATATTSDGRDFYTSNAGLSWVPPVQEKPAAPF